MSTIASYSAATIGSTSMSSTIDCNHPYYLHLFDISGMLITTVVLSESNYNQCRRSRELALSSKLNLGFVEGTCLKPVATSHLMMYWLCCNNVVTSWILNSVSVEIRNSIISVIAKIWY